MFEYHNDILCVHAKWLIEKEIVSEPYYKQLVNRGQFQKLTIGGNGRKALIAFETMKESVKNKVIEMVGNPLEKAKHITFKDYIKVDESAKEFYNSYRLENGDFLPEKNIKEYTANASVLNAIATVIESTMAKRKTLGSRIKPWQKITEIIAELPNYQWPHSLPVNSRRLQDKYKLYKSEGYESLIHRGFCHKNAEKINENAKSWVLARWSDRVKKCTGYTQLLREYNQMAVDQGWKVLKSDLSLKNFLQDPKIEPLWYGYRYGELNSKEKYSVQHSTKLPSLRDSLWYSDGTKLNYYYQDENGKPNTCQVYEVFDTYSEVFLGYYISKSEDYIAQYNAFKMAVQISGHKPYELKFDNQGGTKKLQSTSFLGKLAKITTNTQPYNGKSKTIENAFKRFQESYLKQDWFFTGMNIQAKKAESKANMEMILENAANLPTLDEVKKIYKQRREQWNAAPHPKTGISRLEMYLNSQNPATPEVTIWDMIEMFWITRDKPVTATAYGISFTEKGIKYDYMVYDSNRLPDVRWMRNNIDEKFIIKYDPDDMSLIHLYKETPLGLKRVGEAETKIEIHRNRQEQEAWEAGYIAKVNEQNKIVRIEARDQMDELLKKHKMHPDNYGLTAPRLKGIETGKGKRKIVTKVVEIAEYQKEISNADELTPINIYSNY